MFNLIHNFWFIQALGGVALIFSIIAWNSKTRAKILELQSVNFILFIIHYLLLSAYSGAVMCGVTLARNITFLKKGKKGLASHPIWLYVFILLSILALVFVWRGWITILPAIGVILGTYSVSRENPAQMRFWMLLACLIWIPYTIVVHSYSGLLSQIIGAGAIISGMYRHDRKNNTEEIVLPS